MATVYIITSTFIFVGATDCIRVNFDLNGFQNQILIVVLLTDIIQHIPTYYTDFKVILGFDLLTLTK